MDLVVVGLNHRSSSVSLRERMAMEPQVAVDFLRSLRDGGVVSDGMVVSTCNRVEVYAMSREPATAPARIGEALAARHGLQSADVFPSLYSLSGKEAVEHLFSVCASLDSMVVGEPQILGQVKEAFATAQQAGLTGGAFNRLIQRGFSVAKRVRTETQISRLAVSVSSVAVDLAKKIFQKLDQHTAMLVGAGEMAELAARHFDSAGIKELFILNRTYERAVALAQEFDAVAAPFDKLHSYLAEIDIAVFSVGAPHYVIRAAELESIMVRRRQRPLFLIDIAVPRNIDPACAEFDSVFLYDMDDLEHIADGNKALRTGEGDHARRIVKEESDAYLSWAQAQQAFPIIARLTMRAESIRKAELERTIADLNADPETAEKLERMTASIVRKLLHNPIQAIKAAQSGDDYLVLEAVRQAFGLDDERADAEERKADQAKEA